MMKLRKTAAFVLAALLAAGTVCLTACGGNNEESEKTKQAILGDWVRTETLFGVSHGEMRSYCEVTLNPDITEAQIKAIETKLRGMDGVSDIAYFPVQDGLMEEYSNYFSFSAENAEKSEDILAQIKTMQGVKSTFTDAHAKEEVYGKIYLTETVTDSQVSTIQNKLKKMDTISEWNYYDVNEEIASYKEAGRTDSEIRAMISQGELYSYFDLTIPDARDVDDITAALKQLDGVKDVSATTSYFRFNEDGTVVVMDEYWYETAEEKYDSYSGILVGTYTVEGNMVRTKVEYEGHDVGEELVLQDGKLLQEYPDDGEDYYVDMTDIYEKT